MQNLGHLYSAMECHYQMCRHGRKALSLFHAPILFFVVVVVFFGGGVWFLCILPTLNNNMYGRMMAQCGMS